ncbi:MAG: hypothetical protein WBW27_09060, partial [Pseudolabrys sp.]
DYPQDRSDWTWSNVWTFRYGFLSDIRFTPKSGHGDIRTSRGFIFVAQLICNAKLLSPVI